MKESIEEFKPHSHTHRVGIIVITVIIATLSLCHSMMPHATLIAHPHILVRATSERFLLAWVTLRVGSTSKTHWLQLVLALTVH